MQRSRRPCPAHPQVPGLSEYLELVPLEPESLRSEVASLMAADFGVPAGDAIEVHPGVFRREWTKAAVELDCRDLSSSFDFH